MFMRLSAEQMPLLTQTASGGKRMAIRPRKMSLPHMLWFECGFAYSVLVVRSRQWEAHKKVFEGHETGIIWVP